MPPFVVTVMAASLLFPDDPPTVKVTSVALPVHVPLEYVSTSVVIALVPSPLPNVITILVIVLEDDTVK